LARLILIRHGETHWNLEGRWQGQTDIPLNARGLMQAKQVAADLAGRGLTAIYSSDLSRARQTAEAVARACGLNVHLEPRLREICQGEWEGKLISEIRSQNAALLQQRRENPLTFAAPGGETSLQVQARVVAATENILRKHPDGVTAVVSHGFALAVIIAHYRDIPIEKAWDLIPGNCCPVEIGD
jgi:broad specificity phosphatase PhoE